MLQSLAQKVLGDQAHENQIAAMESGLTYSGYDHVSGIKRLFVINEMLLYLGEDAEQMTIKKLQKYIVYALKGQCKSQYIDRDGDELNTKADIIKCIERCEKSIALKMDIDAKKRNQSDKRGDEKKNGKGGGGRNNGDRKQGDNDKKGGSNGSDNMC